MIKRTQTSQKKYIGGPLVKILLNCLINLAFIPTSIFLSSCSVGLPTENEQTNKDLYVDMGSFTISYPAGDDWTCEADKIKKTLTFIRYKRWITGDILGSTIINVFEEHILSDTFKLGEKETAEDYINKQLQVMKDEGVKKGQYELEDVSMLDTVINVKKFYCMRYETSAGSVWEGDNFNAESMLALYLPSDYLEKRRFYVFIIGDSKRSGSLIGQDVGQLYSVLKSFVIK